MSPSSDAVASVRASSGRAVLVATAIRPSRIELTTMTPAVTSRVPTRRLARALAMSIVPQDRAAPRPVNNPKGIHGA